MPDSKQNTEAPNIGVFSLDSPLELMPFPNGGWTVSQDQAPGLEGTKVGAFTNTTDMLEALSWALGSDA